MDISSFSSVGSPISRAQPASASTVDYDTFLKLLVAEMQNQDPTKPMESTEYISQLASFSNVEQGIQTNEKLDQLLSSSFISGAGSLIGKTISTADGSTSGEIVQVKVAGGVGVAVLDNGDEVPVNDRVVLSGAND